MKRTGGAKALTVRSGMVTNTMLSVSGYVTYNINSEQMGVTRKLDAAESVH